jgi:uncharacterized membrane protein YeaQ/YmgE (transglycosylase-associated protein family)
VLFLDIILGIVGTMVGLSVIRKKIRVKRGILFAFIIILTGTLLGTIIVSL